MSNLIKCSKCGNLHKINNCILVNPNHQSEAYICTDCIADRTSFFRCIECGEYYSRSCLWEEYQGGPVCQNCSSGYFICAECNEVFPHSESNYDDLRNDYLCNSCYESCQMDVENIIDDYYYKPDPIFYGESEDNLYLGVELEVDNTSGNYDKKLIYKAAESILDEYGDQLYLKHDGSLSHGFEIVSHPATLDYHYNDFGWQDIMKICKESTLFSHDTSSCGLHIHLNRDYFGDTSEIQDLHISKLLILVSKFYDSHLLKFSRRQPNELRWCENISIDYEENDDEKTIVDKMKQSKSKGRYTAVNILNSNTIEFRLFKGTLNFNTFIASLQFVMEISKYAKNTVLKSIPTTKWRDIFLSTEFKELKNYLKEKELI